ncbi:hypothetical protein [Actinophytocola xinjiangensis]|jgi:hypothetical protein|nr:hypothetical protein [Actinophytocola xinjiangensis]
MALTLLGVMIVAGCGTGCGTGEQDAKASAAAAANEFLLALEHPDEACRLLAPEALAVVEQDGRRCADALPELRLSYGEAREITVWSVRALVRTNSDTLFLIERETGWQITAAGCVPAEDVTYQCVLAS